jgi:diguanylate cyclase (GGDEF)-like protein
VSLQPRNRHGQGRLSLLFSATLVGLALVLLLDFGVIYSMTVDPAKAGELMKFAYLLTVAGLLLLGFQAVLVFRGIMARMGEDRRRAEELTERIGKLTVIDAQTKTFNRRKFDSVIIRELENTRRYGSLLAGIFFDIDNFKEVNERFGYGEGDKLLFSIARYVNGRIRDTDYLFRWRGGKFLILIPHIELDKAGIVAEKLRRDIEAQTFASGVHTTVSLSVTQAKADDSPETFIQRLQSALTAAKSKGRNRTEMARPS